MLAARNDLIPVEVAVRRYEVGRSTLFEYIRRRQLRRYRRMGDRRTHVSARECEHFFNPKVVD